MKLKFDVQTYGNIMEKLQKNLKEIDARNHVAKAGLFGTNHGSEDGLTNAELGVIHEYGTANIPARPFIGASFEKNKEGYKASLARAVKATLKATDFPFTKLLAAIAAKMAVDMKKYVTAGAPIDPPNSPATAARKQAKGSGTVRPLVDTGRMVNAITWTVGKDEK